MFFKVRTNFLKFFYFFIKRRCFFIFLLFFPLSIYSQTESEAKNKDVFYGKASFYDEFFNGRRTANGERFYHKRLTAAHPKWPFNTLVQVTNLLNNKSVVVRINDRGPFVHGRHIDLSKQAALALDFVESGVAEVKMEVLNWGFSKDSMALANKGMNRNGVKPKREVSGDFHSDSDSVKVAKNGVPDKKTTNKAIALKKSSPETVQNAVPKKPKVSVIPEKQRNEEFKIVLCSSSDTLWGWCVQVGSYTTKENAEIAVNNAVELTNEWSCVQEITKNGIVLYRVVCGNKIDQPKAKEIKGKLAKMYPDAFVTSYPVLMNSVGRKP